MSGEPIESFMLEPATGRAIPLQRGQVLCVEQAGNGQCLDFNAYNLHDYKEQFHSGRTRGLHGINPRVGDHLWSAPPRERPMFTILRDDVGANDVNFSRCSAFLYEAHYGFDSGIAHSNCHDAFAEAIREWELTPDDVHDSFNAFMTTRIDNGRLRIDRSVARAGARLELLAQMDALAVTVCCGGDLGATNNYELKGLKIEVRPASAAEQSCLIDVTFRHQRTIADFANATIKADRELRRAGDYRPHWPWRQAISTCTRIDVPLSEDEQAALERIAAHPRFRHMSKPDILRFALFQRLEVRHRAGIAEALAKKEKIT